MEVSPEKTVAFLSVENRRTEGGTFCADKNIYLFYPDGEKVKLKGKGFPVYKKEGEFGDLYVTYSIKVPTNLTDKQKALFQELSKS